VPAELAEKFLSAEVPDVKTALEGARDIVAEVGKINEVEIVVCPPFTALESVAKAIDGSLVKLGGQNMHPEASGVPPRIRRFLTRT